MAVGVGVGGDDLLVDQPGNLDCEVLLGVENTVEAGVLAGGEQLDPGAGDAPDAIERVAGVAAPSQALLLGALADQIELGLAGLHTFDLSSDILLSAPVRGC